MVLPGPGCQVVVGHSKIWVAGLSVTGRWSWCSPQHQPNHSTAALSESGPMQPSGLGLSLIHNSLEISSISSSYQGHVTPHYSEQK